MTAHTTTSQNQVARYLNGLAVDVARTELSKCCGARRWVERMLVACPFASDQALLTAAEREWWGLGPEDWLEAFTHHPRIGERAAIGWSRHEQAGMNLAEESTRAAIAEGNRLYEEKFGYVFLICATGLSADDMLRALHRRITNAPNEELRIAAEEQAQITRLRLNKLVSP